MTSISNLTPSRGPYEKDVIVLAASAVQLASANSTSEQFLLTLPIPVGTLGLNDTLRLRLRVSYQNNANAKTWRCRWSGQSGTVVWGPTRTTQIGSTVEIEITNRGALNSQIYSCIANNDASTADGNAGGTTSVDTSAQVTLVVSVEKAVGTDSAAIEGYRLELIKG